RHPAAAPRGAGARGDRPRAVEAQEMVNAHGVEPPHRRGETLDPPFVSRRPMRLPAILRMAPKLPVGTEYIRRTTGDGGRPAGAIEREKIRIGPDVGAVVGDKDGDVADQSDAGDVA